LSFLSKHENKKDNRPLS